MRYLFILSGAALAAIAGAIGWRMVEDPLEGERQWLAQQLNNIPPVSDAGNTGEDEAVSWESRIREKPKLWQQLVEPPPPPPPPPKAPPAAPSMAKMLEGVRASTRKVGDSVFMVWPERPSGGFVKIGEQINGCTLKSIERDSVLFVYFWKQGNAEITYSIPRERQLR